jgi:hypothetical protein
MLEYAQNENIKDPQIATWRPSIVARMRHVIIVTSKIEWIMTRGL